jgi:4-amino-4-deoxychorismate lyase
MKLLAVAVAGRGLVDPDAPVFGAGDEALLRGSAAFETLPVYGGRPFLLERHLDRLASSARSLALGPFDRAEAENLVAQVAGEAPSCAVRIFLTEHTLVATAAPLPGDIEERRARGLRLRIVEIGAPPPLLAGAKVTSYAVAMAARREAERHGDDDAILTGGGVVYDAPTANIWWLAAGVLSTPQPGPGVLTGVTASVVREVIPGLGLTLREGAFAVSELAAAEEAFTTSSIVEVMPIVTVDGAPVGNGLPGELAVRLQAELRVRSGR